MNFATRLLLSRWLASVSLIALIMLCLGWEIFWAPLHVGGSLLFLKAVPLLGPLFGILRGKRYTYQWSGMLILFYFTEGIVRAWSELGVGQGMALIEILLSLVFFASVIGYAKWTGPNYQQQAQSKSAAST